MKQLCMSERQATGKKRKGKKVKESARKKKKKSFNVQSMLCRSTCLYYRRKMPTAVEGTPLSASRTPTKLIQGSARGASVRDKLHQRYRLHPRFYSTFFFLLSCCCVTERQTQETHGSVMEKTGQLLFKQVPRREEKEGHVELRILIRAK